MSRINYTLGAFDCPILLHSPLRLRHFVVSSPPVLLSVMMNMPLALTHVFSYLLLALVTVIAKRNLQNLRDCYLQ
jgi:hypothetical protein